VTGPIGRLSGALADRYTIERELGAGGMATVYLAHDIKHDRDVAIKVLKPELAAVLGADRFVVEIKTTAALQHPHILPLFDSGSADGFLFYVMPFIQGETLRGKLDRETQLGIDESVRITRDVADALDYAHRHGVIHRDIKPENILLHDGRPMVADFGIALAVSAAAGGRMTETGMSLGTPHYMSPEQATADKEITGRSDIYSLGSVLFEMLTGNPPHTGSSAQQIIMKIIAEPVEAVTKYRKSVPPNVAAAAAKSLEKLPADRFTSAKEFGDALANPAFRTVAVSSAAQRSRSSSLVSRLSSLLLFAVLVIVAFGAGWLLKRSPAVSAFSGPIYRFNIAVPAGYTRGPGMQLLPDGSGFSMLADGPNGRGVVIQSFAGGPPRFFAAANASIGAYVVPGESGVMYYTFPGAGTSQIQLLPFTGAPGRIVTDSLRFGVAFEQDGAIIATHLTTGGLARLTPDGHLEVLTRPDTAAGELDHRFPEIVAEGRALAFHIQNREGSSRLAFLDLRTRQVHRSVEGINAEMLPNGYLTFNRGGIIYAGRVDFSRLEFQGTPVPVLRGAVNTTVSRTGALAYRETPEKLWYFHPDGAENHDPTITGNGAPVTGIRIGPGTSGVLTLEGTRDLWVHARDGASRHLALPGRTHRLGGWSADGTRILYVEYTRDPSVLYTALAGTLVEVRVDGTAQPEPVGRGTGDSIREADWGRGGIAYATIEGTVMWLADGASQPVRIGAGERGTGQLSWADPAVSPDGRYIAFRGKNSLVMVAAVPPATGSWEIGPGSNPKWSHDGKYLYYDQVRPPYRTAGLPVMRVSVTPGAAFANGKSEVAANPPPDATLFWDIGADNAVHWVTHPQTYHYVLVVNWAREVDSLVRASTGGHQ
jgi:serine/threonine-protein kinase